MPQPGLVKPTADRLHILTASTAPLATVFWHSQAGSWHLMQWHTDQDQVDHGVWYDGQLFPQQSNCSPDGSLLAVFGGRGDDPADPWSSYFALTRSPWLVALAAWRTYGNLAMGCRVGDDGSVRFKGPVAEMFQGTHDRAFDTLSPDPHPHDPITRQFERGWVIVPPSRANPPVEALLTTQVPNPASAEVLGREHKHAGGALMQVNAGARTHFLVAQRGSGYQRLEGVIWADWSPGGFLLTATAEGRIQRRQITGDTFEVAWEMDLCPLEPQRTHPPRSATRW